MFFLKFNSMMFQSSSSRLNFLKSKSSDMVLIDASIWLAVIKTFIWLAVNKTATAGPSYTKGRDVWYVMGISKKAWRHFHSGVNNFPSDNNFQPITRFVSLEMLGNEIVVGVTLHEYGGKPVTCFNFYIKLLKQSAE